MSGSAASMMLIGVSSKASVALVNNRLLPMLRDLIVGGIVSGCDQPRRPRLAHRREKVKQPEGDSNVPSVFLIGQQKLRMA